MARPQNCNKCKKPKRPKGKKFKELPGYCECGRPPKIDKNTLTKLEDAFSLGMSDDNACSYAEIDPRTLYRYQEKNPEYSQRKAMLKRKPNVRAFQTIVNSLGDPNHAWRWLERKDPEFKPVSKVEHSGEVEIIDKVEEMSPEEKAAVEVLRKAKKDRLADEIKKA